MHPKFSSNILTLSNEEVILWRKGSSGYKRVDIESMRKMVRGRGVDRKMAGGRGLLCSNEEGNLWSKGSSGYKCVNIECKSMMVTGTVVDG